MNKGRVAFESSLRGVGARALVFLTAVGAFGCGAEASPEIGQTQSALVVTNCSGLAISAAVAAGGDVVLDCGPTPVTVSVPSTNVTLATRLRPAIPGNVTLTHSGSLFRVSNNAAFQIENLRFSGSSGSSIGVHVLSGSATVIGSTFTGYGFFALSVHGSASRLTVSRSTFSSNGSASGMFAAPIYSEGSTVQVFDSTFSNNRTGGSGGAITALGGGLTVSGSTFVSNAAGSGGAIYVSGGTNSITNSTFAFNQAQWSDGAIRVGPFTSLTIRNSTFADNPAPGGIISAGAQLFNSILLDRISPSTAGCQLAGSGNIQWPQTRPLCGPGFRYADPRLGSPANNGGPTQTMALNPGSGAIDSASGACPGTDQRGFFRPRDGDGNGSFICDVGAFER